MDSLLPLGFLLALIACQADPASAGCDNKSQDCNHLTGSAPKILGALATDWAAVYAQHQPNAAIIIPTPLGPPQGKLDPHLQAFLDGRSDFAFLTREIAEADLERFRTAHDSEPVILPVAGGSWNSFGYVDPVVIIVNEANPVRSLSFEQLDAIFSSSRLRGRKPLTDWGAAGAKGWQGQPIRIMGGGGWQDEESARALTLRRHVLSVGSKRGTWRLVPDSGSEADVVERVARDPLAIGFTGFGHMEPGVRVVAVAERRGGRPVAPTREAIESGRYPLGRTVDLLLARRPDGCVSPPLAAFAAFLVGREGQQVVRRQPPFLPLTREQAAAAQKRLRAAVCDGASIRN